MAPISIGESPTGLVAKYSRYELNKLIFKSSQKRNKEGGDLNRRGGEKKSEAGQSDADFGSDNSIKDQVDDHEAHKTDIRYLILCSCMYYAHFQKQIL